MFLLSCEAYPFKKHPLGVSHHWSSKNWPWFKKLFCNSGKPHVHSCSDLKIPYLNTGWRFLCFKLIICHFEMTLSFPIPVNDHVNLFYFSDWINACCMSNEAADEVQQSPFSLVRLRPAEASVLESRRQWVSDLWEWLFFSSSGYWEMDHEYFKDGNSVATATVLLYKSYKL